MTAGDDGPGSSDGDAEETDSDGSTAGDGDGDPGTGETSDSSDSSGDTSDSSGSSTSSGDGDGESSSSTSAGSGSGGEPNEDGWAIVDVGTDEDLVAVDFADDAQGWIVGTGAVLLHTADGGENWASQEDGFWGATVDTKQLDAHVINPYPAWGVYHLLDVHAVSPDVAWLASIGPLKSPPSLNGDYLSAVFVTTDGGASWKRLTLATNFQVWGIHGFDGQSARPASIGSSNHPDSDIYLVDAGASQGSVPMTWQGLRDITFVDGSVGFTAGLGISKSVDGGQSWNSTDAPEAAYWAVDFPTPTHGFAVGEAGEIVGTQNAGQSWSSQNSGTQADLYGVSFADTQHGLVVGDGGTVLVTDDGGQSWTAEDPGTQAWINDGKLLSAGVAWAVADGGVLVHRTP